MCMIRSELKFEDYKNCLEANRSENKINYLENDNTDANSLKENHKEFIKDNRLILKLQQRFRSKKHNVFTEKVNKIELSTDNDKRIQSIDSTETYTYGTSKDKIRRNGKNKCKNIIKQYKND